MAGPLVLSYNLSPDKQDALRALCDAQGIRLRAVSPGELALPVGALAGLPCAVKPASGAPLSTFSDEMLVMCHMLSPQLDAFLAGLRGSGVGPIPLKAVLTPTNVAWSALQLHDELAREHAAMLRTRK